MVCNDELLRFSWNCRKRFAIIDQVDVDKVEITQLRIMFVQFFFRQTIDIFYGYAFRNLQWVL